MPDWLSKASLRNQAAEARGPEGLLYLRREIHGRVDVMQDPRKARSQLTLRHVVTLRGAGDSPVILPLLLPPHAESPTSIARVIGVDGESRPWLDPVLHHSPSPEARRLIDRSQTAYELRFPPLAPGEILEVITACAVRGSLTSDAQWIQAADLPTRELMVRYDLPPAAQGALVVHGHGARPMVAKRDEGEVLALRIQELEPGADNMAHYRYTTRSADPQGYKQRFSRSWADVAGEAVRDLAGMSEKTRGAWAVPYQSEAEGDEAVADIFRWVRDRIQRDDALKAHWSEGRPLARAIMSNDLTSTDKVHLLGWLLDTAGVSTTYAIARDGSLPRLGPEFPVPDAFGRALLYLPERGLWLDPACQTCGVGEVRPTLRGGQGLRLDNPNEGPLNLPAP